MEIEYPVNCPLMESAISMDEYFDIHMVVEGAAPAYTAQEKAIRVPHYKQICRSCRYHRDD